MSTFSIRSIAVGVFLLGVALRLSLSIHTYGTSDVDGWIRHAQNLRAVGLVEDYRSDPSMNHPPVICLVMRELLTNPVFAPVPLHIRVKLPSLLGEFLMLSVLCAAALREGSAVSLGRLAVLSLSAINILISGYHGNTDGLVAAGIFLGCWFFASGRYELSGLALALGTEVKLIPLILVPVFLAALPRTARRRWMLWFAIGMAPIVGMLLVSGLPFMTHVLGYSSAQDYWGVVLLLDVLSGIWRGATIEHDSVLVPLYVQMGKVLVIGSVCWIAALNRSDEPGKIYSRCAAALCIFAVLAPGFSIQYFAIYPAVIGMISIRWSAAVSILGGLLAAMSYRQYLVSTDPLRSIHIGPYSPEATIVGAVLWLALGLLFLRILDGRVAVSLAPSRALRSEG